MNDIVPIESDESSLSSENVDQRSLLKVAFLFLVLLLLVFSRCLAYPLLDWDDEMHLTQNPNLNPVTLSSLGKIWSEPYEGLYIPLSYTFFAGETAITRLLGGQNQDELSPYLFHAGNLCLHLINSLLIYQILFLLVKDRQAACLGGLLFLLHPLQVESVVWISETRGLLSNCFSISAIYFSLIFASHNTSHEQPGSSSESKPKPASHSPLIAASFCFLLSLLAKPSSVTTPLIIGILVIGFFPAQLKSLRLWIAGWLILAVAFILLNRGEQAELLFESPLWARPLIAGDSLTFYLWKLVVPYPLAMQYDKSIQLILETGTLYWFWIIPCVLLLIACFVRQRRIWLTIAGVFIVGLLPVLGLIPFAYQFVSNVADRYVYLSLLAPALAVAWLMRGVSHLAPRIVVTVLLLVCASLSYFQTATWGSNQSLYQHCLTVNPRAFIALSNLGHLAFQSGKYDTALHYFEKSLAVIPDDAGTHQNLGTTLMKLGKETEAIKHHQRVLEIDPQHPGAHLALGVYSESQDQLKHAFDHYLQTLQADPQNIFALQGLGNIARKQQNFKDALKYYQRALRFQPDDVALNENLGMLYLELGEEQNAIQQFERARKRGSINPANEFNLGLIAANNRNLPQAIRHYETALNNIDPKSSAALYQKIRQELALTSNLLGTILQQQGQHTQAIPKFETAIKYADDLAPAYYNLAESLQQLQQTTAALSALNTALKLVPAGSEPARDIQKRIDLYQKQ
ncbi:tetratricopeptide repeat protein [Gimesia algae]|uniref:TPR repeat-containing protein YrrB n=1 Tax=Gimesia algae TaxID=2527971 RepID=A0A517VJV9_9PLAN|nr:tetratricopeptide repeat protein [Gimesia algae]QDT93240.1 TPR repeat-containing protein YrrB [Gimesia algae]